MNDVTQRTLRNVIRKYGTDVCSDARRCEGLLRDLSGEHRREINILISALKERVPLDLLAAGNAMPRELLLTRLEKRLEDNLALTPEAARWAVESWALALNLVTDSEIENRQKKQAESIKQTQIEENREKTASNNPTPQPQPKAQPQTPKTQPPIFRPKATAQTPPKITTAQPTGNAPVVQQPQAPAPTATTKASPKTNPQSQADPKLNNPPKRRLINFRGCFIGCFLFVILSLLLFFGGGYAFKVMRETQQPRTTEPPRFPKQ